MPLAPDRAGAAAPFTTISLVETAWSASFTFTLPAPWATMPLMPMVVKVASPLVVPSAAIWPCRPVAPPMSILPLVVVKASIALPLWLVTPLAAFSVLTRILPPVSVAEMPVPPSTVDAMSTVVPPALEAAWMP